MKVNTSVLGKIIPFVFIMPTKWNKQVRKVKQLHFFADT